jgi:hypothetical protein
MMTYANRSICYYMLQHLADGNLHAISTKKARHGLLRDKMFVMTEQCKIRKMTQ